MFYYYRYRKTALSQSLQAIGQQVQQFGLMIAALFQAYLLGLIAVMFMGIGKIVESDDPATAVQVAWGLIAAQSFILLVFRDAVLDKPHRSYHFTLLRTTLHQKIADGFSLLVVHPLLLMTLILGYSIGIDKLPQAGSLIAFAVTQLVVALCFVYRPLGTSIGLIFSAGLSLVMVQIAWYLAALNLFALAGALLLPRSIMVSISVRNLTTFWLSFIYQHYFIVLWRVVMSVLVLWFGVILQAERPDLMANYVPGLVSLNLLWWSSLAIDLKPEVAGRAAFWLSINKLTRAKQSVWIVIIGTAICFSFPVYMILGFSMVGLLPYVFLPLLVLSALKSPQHLAIAWLSTLVLSYTVFVNL
ncbi:DUF6136 family protein [Pseudoalteromonas piscicida]|uniref:DUF6136 family protein n=1 Tax=Pseudoalteromonas piscicida TaxID=43662 RepID=UPI0030B214A8